MRWSVARGLVAWVALSLLGTVIIALPDSGPRMVALSKGHGPSAVDAAGIVLVLAGWLAFAIPLWNARSAIAHRWALAIVAAAGGALLAWSIATDAGTWWILGIAMLVATQVAAGVSAIRQ